jgi:hypothetical protein
MTDRLLPNETLKAGDSLTSPSGGFKLTMKLSGNLALTATSTGFQLWSTNTFGQDVVCTLQDDGDLVVKNNRTLWNSRTTAQGAYLVLLDDGSLVIRKPGGFEIWRQP